MRLNEKTYPAYNILQSGEYSTLKIDEMIYNSMLNTTKDFYDFLNCLRKIFSQVDKKYYLTSPFKKAIITALPKIIKDDKHINNTPCDCGVIFTDDGFSVYLSNPTDKKIKLLCYGFTRDTLTTYAIVDNEGKYGGMACSIKDGKPINDMEALGIYVSTFLTTLYFIHNCEIEQKILKPNDKYRSNGDKHYNESNSDLIILDCRWFTELIRDIPFHVRGHLRWQVHGERNTKRKIKWIPDFEKSGYHRKASKELSNI